MGRGKEAQSEILVKFVQGLKAAKRGGIHEEGEAGEAVRTKPEATIDKAETSHALTLELGTWTGLSNEVWQVSLIPTVSARIGRSLLRGAYPIYSRSCPSRI